jgi:hypothetical protein
MGTFSTLAAAATALQALIVVGAVLLGASLLTLAVMWFVEQRPMRLARHESIPTYYFSGHAFSH